MQDKELYRQLLGLKEPWDVSEIKVDYAGLRVDLWITWPLERKAPCPECGEPTYRSGGCPVCPTCGWSRCG